MRRRFWLIAVGTCGALLGAAGIWWKVAFGLIESGHAPGLAGVPVLVPETVNPALCSGCEADHGELDSFGKREVETVAEWHRTPAAAAGNDCASCHPAGVGVKTLDDVSFLSSAFHASAKFISDGEKLVGKLDFTATEVGQRLPTRPGPELWLEIAQLDRAGLELEGTVRQGVVGRRMSSGGSELFDTRLFPGEKRTLAYDARLDADASAVVARVRISKDGAAKTAVWEQREDWIGGE